MKQIAQLIILISLTFSQLLANPLQASADPPTFFSYVNQQWLEGNKKQVLQLAEVRLKSNPNDLASLLIELDYAVSFMEIKRIKDLLPVVRQLTLSTDTPNFSKEKKLLIADLDAYESLLPSITEQMAQDEARKGAIKGKPLSSEKFIVALEQDGLVPALTSSETSIFPTR